LTDTKTLFLVQNIENQQQSQKALGSGRRRVLQILLPTDPSHLNKKQELVEAIKISTEADFFRKYGSKAFYSLPPHISGERAKLT
jgi:hypothetical protein